MLGIDVSEHQGTINWLAVSKTKGQKVDFAMIRCGWCGYDGLITKGIDKQFNRNMIESDNVGIHRGVYVYSYAKNVTASIKAADQVLNLVKPYKLTFPIAFDIEDVLYTQMSAMETTKIVQAFCDTIEAAGYYVMFYCSTYFYFNNLYGSMLSKYDFWLADWTNGLFNLRSCGIHQYSNSGKIDGIMGNVDLNLAIKNYPAIIGNVKEKYTFTDLKTNIMKELDKYESLLG